MSKKKRSRPKKIKPGDLAKDYEPQDEYEKRLAGLLARDGELIRELDKADSADAYFKSRVINLLEDQIDKDKDSSKLEQSFYQTRTNVLTNKNDRSNSEGCKLERSFQNIRTNVLIHKNDRSNTLERSFYFTRTTLEQSESPILQELETTILQDIASARPSPRFATITKVLDTIFEKIDEIGAFLMSITELQQATGLSRQTAWNALKFLINKGYIDQVSRSYYKIGTKLQNWYYSIVSSSNNNINTTTYSANVKDRRNLATNPFAICGFYADYRFKRQRMNITLLNLPVKDIQTFAEFILNYGLVNFYIFVDYVVERNEEIRNAIAFVRKVISSFQLPVSYSMQEIQDRIRAVQAAIRFDPENPNERDIKDMANLDIAMRTYALEYLKEGLKQRFIEEYRRKIVPSVEVAIRFVERATMAMKNSQKK